MTFEELNAQFAAFKTQQETVVGKLAAENSKLSVDNQHLKLRIAKLQAMLFGRSSERREPNDNSAQGLLFAVAAAEIPKKEAVASVTVAQHTRQVREDRKEVKDEEQEEGFFPEHLPRVEQIIDELPEGANRDDWSFVADKITERLGESPSHQFVVQTIRKTYKKKATGAFYAPVAPRHIFGRCSVDESFLINMAIKKFMWHLPLYRQHQALQLQRINIPRANFAAWMIKLGGVFSPVVRAIGEDIKTATTMHVDESPFMVGKLVEHGGKEKTAFGQGYLWPILAPDIGVMFSYSPGRSYEDGKRICAGFKGTIVSDAFIVYEKLVSELSLSWQLCFMHIRRNFIDAEESNAQKAGEALKFIRALYQVESDAKDKPPDQRLSLRLKHSEPILIEFKKWLRATMVLPEAVTDPKLSAAIFYVYTRWEHACLFLKDGNIPIDNGAAERVIRPSKLGAKNWLFAASEMGAETIATFYSLIHSSMMHGIHPYYYLLDLCKRIDQRALKPIDLTPRYWKQRFFEEAVPEHLRKPIVKT